MNFTDNQVFDGDGQRIKLIARVYTEELNQTYTTVSYYVRSSVLGRQAVTDLDGQGQKWSGFVYWGGAAVAWQHAVGAQRGASQVGTLRVVCAITSVG